MQTPMMVLRAALPAALFPLIFASSAQAQEQTPPAAKTETLLRRAPKDMKKSGWTLTFSDDFKGKTLDTKKWIDSYPFGVRTHSNNEQQYYAPDGVSVEKGTLRFKAERREMGKMPYTSGMATTFGKFSQKYGWFEIRAKFPKGKGMWPAFWLLPENGKAWPPEVDILEILGHEPNIVYLTNHWKPNNGKEFESKGDKFVGPDFSQDFHTFALEWKPDEMIWYVDGVERFSVREHVPQEGMYVLLNLAVGGNWPGMPTADTPFPSYMETDYLRVYQNK